MAKTSNHQQIWEKKIYVEILSNEVVICIFYYLGGVLLLESMSLW